MADETLPLSKYTKEETGYRATSLAYPCRTCRYFGVKDPMLRHTVTDPSTCDIVEGEIHPGATCILWNHHLAPLIVRKEVTPENPPRWWKFPMFRNLAVRLYGRAPMPDFRRKR